MKFSIAALAAAVLFTTAADARQSAPSIDALSDFHLTAEVRASFAEADTSGAMAKMAAAFPDEYAAFVASIVAALRTGEPLAAVHQRSFDFSANLFAENLYRIAEADDQHLLQIAAARLDLLLTLQRGHMVACHEFLETGLSAGRNRELGTDGLASSARLTAAMLDAMIAPVSDAPRSPQPPEDVWEGIGGRYATLGGSLSWLGVYFSGDDGSRLSGTQRCESAVAWERAIHEAGPDVVAAYIREIYSPEPPTSPPPAEGESAG